MFNAAAQPQPWQAWTGIQPLPWPPLVTMFPQDNGDEDPVAHMIEDIFRLLNTASG